MERSDLVLSIVFNNDNAFKNLTKEETRNILLATKISQENQNIKNMIAKYTAEYFYRLLHNNIYDCSKKEDILERMYSSSDDIQDCFKRIIMATYKELIYCNKTDDVFSHATYDMMLEYKKIVYDNEEFYDPYNHEHDPRHYIFADGKRCYLFYELFEKHGYNLLY